MSRRPHGVNSGSGAMLTVMLVALAISNTAESAGSLQVQFLEYKSGGYTASGAPCDSVGGDGRCDPQFRVTAEKQMKGGEVVFTYQQAGYYSKQDTVHFISTFGEKPNPLVIDLNYHDNAGDVWLTITVMDIGSGNGGLMSKFSAMLQTSGTGVRNLELKSAPNHSLTLRYWYSCSDNYFGAFCNKHCSGDRHGICDSNGDIICAFGWVDASTGCKKPHPCRTCACQNGGVCIPHGAEGFTCRCPAGYHGATCSACYLEASQCGKSSPAAHSCDPLMVQLEPAGCISVKALVGSIGGTTVLVLILSYLLFCLRRRRSGMGI